MLTNSPPASDERWWKSLGSEECPITLEPLATLPYPPFALKTGENTSYFDGLALASYIVSRGIFQNPLTWNGLGPIPRSIHLLLLRFFQTFDSVCLCQWRDSVREQIFRLFCDTNEPALQELWTIMTFRSHERIELSFIS